ncbi:MAG: hypothetical protein FWE02_07020 [Defluviitaleaceae bacterium]|nr:hypothetical protein [Defluviitaleaceae bacterium]
MNTSNKLKSELVDEFVKLGGNYSKDAAILERKSKKFLKDTGESDIHILEILRMLRAYEKEINYKAFDEACEIVSSITERLLSTNINKWVIEDVKIAQIAILWAKNFKEADTLANKILATLKRLNTKESYKIELSVHINMTERMIIADTKEIEDWKDSFEVEKIFREHETFGLAICKNIGEELKLYEILIKIRVAVFSKEFEKADNLLEDFKKVAPKDFHKAVKESVAISSVGETFYMTKKQFQHLCGRHMREKREADRISPKKLAQDLGGITEATIN